MDQARLVALSVAVAVNIGLGLAVYLRNSRSVVNRTFAAVEVTLVAWRVLSFMSDLAFFRSQALLLNRLTLAAGTTMAVLLVYFAIVFPRPEGPLRIGWRAFLGVGLLIAALTSATPLTVANVGFESWGTNIVSGPLLPLLAAWCGAGIVCIVTVLIRRYRRVSGRPRAQLKFVLLGLVLFAVSGLFFALLLPMATGSYRLSFLNTFASLFLVGFTAYAIVKHRLMDIQLVVLRGAVYTVLLSTWVGLTALALSLIRLGFSMPASPDADMLFFLALAAVLFAFQPARRVVEGWTDRYFYRRRYDPQLLLAELSAKMASTLDLHQLAELIAGTLQREMQLAYAAVARNSELARSLIASTSTHLSAGAARDLLDLCTGPDIILVDDLDPSSEAGSLMAAHETSGLVPLVVENTVIGAVLLGGRRSGEAFTTLDIGFLRIVAPGAAIAVKNAELFDETKRRVGELTALNRLALALGANADLEAILGAGLEQVLAATAGDSGSVMLLEDGGETLVIRIAQGLSEDIVATTRIRIGEGIAGQVALSGKALILPQADEVGAESGLRRCDVASAMCVPLIWKDDVTGVLCINRRRSAEPFTRQNLEVAASFAGQLAVMIANAKLTDDMESTSRGATAAHVARDAAQKASQAKSAFLAHMTHEIRTPLNAVLGFAQLMRRDPGLTPTQRQRLDTINSSGESLLALVNGVLEMSRIESGRTFVTTTVFDPRELLGEIERMFRIRTTEKGLTLTMRTGEGVPAALAADEGKLRQILVNLLGNAVKFTGFGGISVRTDVERCERHGMRLLIEVQDTGIGIAEEDADRVFEYFEQARGPQGLAEGTGLGLPICREYARLMGGDIELTSEVGVGSVFRVDVAVVEARPAELPERADARRIIGLEEGQPRYRVLIADDVEDNRELLEQLLSAIGFEIASVASGEQALEAYREQLPDLVLMDLRMPGMDGYEAMRRIRECEGGADAKIIAVTASPFSEIRDEALATEADDFVAKPYRETELLSKIGGLLGARYVYAEEPESDKAPSAATGLTRASLAGIPTDLAESLLDAVRSADFDRVLALTEGADALGPSVKAGLRSLADAFDSETIIGLLAGSEDE